MTILFIIIAFFLLSRTSGTVGVSTSSTNTPMAPTTPAGGVAVGTVQGSTANDLFGNGSYQMGLDPPIVQGAQTIQTGGSVHVCPAWGCGAVPVTKTFIATTKVNMPPPTNPIANHPLMVAGILRETVATL